MCSKQLDAYRIFSVLGRDPFSAIANGADVAALTLGLSLGLGGLRPKDVFTTDERQVGRHTTIRPGDVLVFTLSDARERIQRLGPSRLRRLRNGRPDRTREARGLSLTSLSIGVAVVGIGVGAVGRSELAEELGLVLGRVQHGRRMVVVDEKELSRRLACFIRVRLDAALLSRS